MPTLFGNLESGNVHKVMSLLRLLGVAYTRVDVAQVRGEPRHPAILALNPIGKVPVLRLDDGTVTSESGAILFRLAQGTPFWPTDVARQTEVLRWMFFEQYSHEPSLAVLRYLKNWAASGDRQEGRWPDLERRGRQALEAMASQLQHRTWIVGTSGPSIADLALYPYTRWAPEAGIGLEAFPTILGWAKRLERLPGFLPLYAEGATSVISFGDWLGAAGSGEASSSSTGA